MPIGHTHLGTGSMAQATIGRERRAFRRAEGSTRCAAGLNVSICLGSSRHPRHCSRWKSLEDGAPKARLPKQGFDGGYTFATEGVPVLTN